MAFLNSYSATVGSLNATTGNIDINDADDIAIQISGTFVGTITFYASIDGTTFYGFALHQSSNTTGTTDTTTATVPLLLSKKCSAFAYFKVIMTAYTSGSATLDIHTSRVVK